ncbi:D-serine ammonia-lyase, partial [bacterium]|nr:D-serine ammonia-lyase [bacterium]
MIGDKTLNEWIQEHPQLKYIISGDEVFWSNPHYCTFESAQTRISFSETHIKDAEKRFNRFAPYISRVFPETLKMGGIIESPLIRTPALQHNLVEAFGREMKGSL